MSQLQQQQQTHYVRQPDGSFVELLPERQSDLGFLPAFPAFPEIASAVDKIARRVPWWVWLGLGGYAIYRWGPRKGG